MAEVNLYRAVEMMKDITKAEGTFSIKFRKYDRVRKTGGDLVRLSKARLRKKPSDKDVSNASHKLFLLDTETGHPRVCWQILVVEFNGMKTVI